MLNNSARSLFLSSAIIGLLAQHIWAAPPQLHIVGNQIVTVSGNCPVRLYGIDYSGLEFSPGGEGPSTTTVDGVTMQNVVAGITAATNGSYGWHGNCVRLPLNQDFWFGIENSTASSHGYSSVSQQAYRDMVMNVINYCSSNNIWVDLDLHWSGTSSVTTPTAAVAGSNGWGTSNGQQPMPDWNSITFWQSVASTSGIQNNPAVIFDLYNEPYDPSGSDTSFWSVWRNGGSAGSFNTPGLQTILNYIRGAGANNVVIAGGLQWAYDLKGVPTYALSDPSGNGVLYSAHIYSSKGTSSSSWDPYVTTIVGSYPVIVEEFGASSSDGASFDNTVIGWLNGSNPKSYVYSAMAWAFSPDVGPTLLTSWTNFPPTSYHGVPVQSWQQNLATTPTVACGNASPTNTPQPTASNTPASTPTRTPSFSFSPTPSPSSTITPSFTPQPTLVPCPWSLRMRGGATSSYTDSQGNTWQPDQVYATGGNGYVAGTASTTTNAIAGTSDQPLYQTERYNSTLEYKFTVPNGTYRVTLKFAEFYWTAAGQRVFNIAIQGNTVASGVDIYAAVGGNKAYDKVFWVNVSTGILDIVETATTDNAKVDAIELIGQISQCTPTPTPTSSNTPLPPSPTKTASRTPSFSSTPSSSASQTATNTLTATRTVTPSNTLTATPSASPTSLFSFTSTPSFSPQNTFTATRTSTLTATPSSTYTPSTTASPSFSSSATLSSSPSFTPVNTFTNTRTASPTLTPSLSFTPSASFTLSSSPSATSSFSPSVTAINTFTSTRTASPTATSSPSATLSASFTATGSPSSTLSSSPSSTPANSFTSTRTATASSSPTPSFTPSFSASPTPSGSPSRTASASPTNSSTASPSPTFSSTYTSVPPGSTPTDTPSISPTFSDSPSTTPTASPSATPSSFPSFTASFSPTDTPSHSPSSTATPTASPSATPSFSPSFTVSFSPTGTPSHSPSSTATPTGSPSATPSITASVSPSVSPSPSFSASATPSASKTNTPLASPTDSATVTMTFTPLPSPSFTGTQSATRSFTPSFTGTPSITFSNTPSFSPTPTHTALAATLTFSATPSATPQPSGSATFSSTPTPSLTAILSAAASATQTATAGPDNAPPRIIKIFGHPNPNPASLSLLLAGPADTVQFRLYTKAMILVDASDVGAVPAGWKSFPIPAWLHVAPGTYFVLAKAARSGSITSLAVAKLVYLP